MRSIRACGRQGRKIRAPGVRPEGRWCRKRQMLEEPGCLQRCPRHCFPDLTSIVSDLGSVSRHSRDRIKSEARLDPKGRGNSPCCTAFVPPPASFYKILKSLKSSTIPCSRSARGQTHGKVLEPRADGKGLLSPRQNRAGPGARGACPSSPLATIAPPSRGPAAPTRIREKSRLCAAIRFEQVGNRKKGWIATDGARQTAVTGHSSSRMTEACTGRARARAAQCAGCAQGFEKSPGTLLPHWWARVGAGFRGRRNFPLTSCELLG